MAENLQVPSAKTPLVEGAAPARPWFTFWSLLGKRQTALANVATVTTANAIDAATTMALVNELKAKLNEVLNTQRQ